MNVLGIDIGGSGIKAAVVNVETGELITERHRIPTPRPAKPKKVAKVINALVKHFNWNGVIGCGFPTIIENGKSTSLGNLHHKWLGRNVEKVFSKATKQAVTVINDADAAGYAEIKFGAGKGKKGVVTLITIGTGIGSSIFFNGKLIPNSELGRMLHENGEIYEHYAADSVRKQEGLSFSEWGARFNEFLHHSHFIIPANLYILGGGISKKLHKFEDQITLTTPLVAAQAQNQAGIIGAALAAAVRAKK